MSYAPAGTKNDATQTSTSTAASTVNAVGNLSFFAAGSPEAGAGSSRGAVVAMAAASPRYRTATMVRASNQG